MLEVAATKSIVDKTEDNEVWMADSSKKNWEAIAETR